MGTVAKLPQSLKEAYESFLQTGVKYAFGQVETIGALHSLFARAARARAQTHNATHTATRHPSQTTTPSRWASLFFDARGSLQARARLFGRVTHPPPTRKRQA